MDDFDDEPRRPLTAAIAAWIWIVHGIVGLLFAICLFLVVLYVVLGAANQPEGLGYCACCTFANVCVGFIPWMMLKRGLAYFRGRTQEPGIDATVSLVLSAVCALFAMPATLDFFEDQSLKIHHVVWALGTGAYCTSFFLAGVLAIVSRKPYLKWVYRRIPLYLTRRTEFEFQEDE